jgi:predicted ArsR family transcriptional regulator
MKQMIRAVERLEAEQGALAERGHFAEVEALQPLIDRLRTQAMRTRSSDRDFVIAAIDKEGCYTETDIIAQTRLTRHTVRLALQHLIRRGIVEAYQEVRPCPGSGRRPILYRTTGVTKRSNSTKNHLDWSNSSSVVM